MLIKNGLVFISSENSFVKKDIAIKNGKILEIGELCGNLYSTVIDANGKYVTPGFIDAHSHIGIGEEGVGWEGADYNEGTSAVTPAMRGIDGINPANISFTEALRGGVTTACVGPGSANVVGGQFSTISLSGKIIDKMIIKEYTAMKCAFGENPKRFHGREKGRMPSTRMGTAFLLRKVLQDTKNYMEKQKASLDKGEIFPVDLDMEAMIPVIERKVHLKAHAHRADDICTAIRIAKEFNVLMSIEHCTEGHLIANFLKESNVPAIIGPTFSTRSKIELMEKSFETPKILHDAGVKFAIMTDHHVIPQYALVMCAALAMKAGLDECEAINAITKNPAEILGIDDLKGQIKVGLDADIVIWNDHPLNIQAKVEKVFIKGEEIL